MHIFVLERKMLRSLIGRNLFITGTQLRGNLTAFLFKHFFQPIVSFAGRYAKRNMKKEFRYYFNANKYS